MSRNPVTMAEVVDRLFTRLAATYGPEWTRQCGATPMSDIKTVWGHELAGYINHLGAIAHALDSLPERCPNVIQFKNLCRAAPKAQPLLLAEPKSDPVFVKQVLDKLAAPAPKIDSKDWARRILARKADGEIINPTALKMAQGALA